MPTKKEVLVDRRRIAEQHLTCLNVVLAHLAAGDKPDAELLVEKDDDHGHHQLQLYDVTAAHGGVVFVVGIDESAQKTTFGAVYLEQVAHYACDEKKYGPPSHLDEGYRRLLAIRDRAYLELEEA